MKDDRRKAAQMVRPNATTSPSDKLTDPRT
jgi:hypothetical protein